MRAGRLRHRVTIRKGGGSLSGTGGTTSGTPTTVAEHVAAAIDAIELAFQARERIAAGGQQAETRYVIEMRYRAGLTLGMHLVEECCDQRTFEIVATRPDTKRRLMVAFECVER